MKKKKEIDQHGHQSGKIVLIILFIIIFIPISCSLNKNIIDHNDVEAIKFWYLSKGLLTIAAIEDCADVVYHFKESMKDTIISNRSVIKQYIEVINRLKPSKKRINYDLRVASAIKFIDNKKENMGVCVSFNGVTLVDDVLMKKDMRIVNLLDEILYNHLTERDWTFPFLLEDHEE
jgi:hypothetical protein